MASFGGFNWTTFQGVNLKSTAAVRFVADGGFEGTLGVKEAADSAYAWKLPQKSGTFPISGTFTVQLPAISANTLGETNVTITGIRSEDALTCTILDTFNTVTTDRGMAFLAGARPANGGAHLTFYNPTGTATIYNELILSYTAAR